MTNNKEKPREPACPSCGQPVRSGLLPFKISNRVKMILAVLLVGYVILSTFLLRMSLPIEMRRRHQPASFDSWMLPLSQEPVFQIIAVSGFAIGVLIFYWEWFHDLYENWQKRQENPVKKPKSAYKYKCSSCGREWN